MWYLYPNRTSSIYVSIFFDALFSLFHYILQDDSNLWNLRSSVLCLHILQRLWLDNLVQLVLSCLSFSACNQTYLLVWQFSAILIGYCLTLDRSLPTVPKFGGFGFDLHVLRTLQLNVLLLSLRYYYKKSRFLPLVGFLYEMDISKWLIFFLWQQYFFNSLSTI